MPTELPSPSNDETGPTARGRGRAYWIIVAGGLAVALGTVITAATHWDLIMLNGFDSISMPRAILYLIIGVEGPLTLIGDLLWAAGFLAVVLGVAWAARTPHTHGRTGSPRRRFAVPAVGGSLVAAGLVILGVLGYYAYSPTGVPGADNVQYALDLAARIVEAIGFFVAFAGVAEALRP